MDDLEVIFNYDGNELAIDKAGRLYWNKRPVVVEQPLTLRFWQKFGAIITVVSATILALIEVLRFLGEVGLIALAATTAG